MDAIRKDGSGSETGEEGGEATDQAVLSPRELMMQEISDQIAGQQEAAAVADADAAASVNSPLLPSVLDDDQLDKVMVRVKVDGQVVELPLSEVTKGYQKDAVASRRLAQAAEERKLLDAEKMALAEQKRQIETAGTLSLEDDGDVDAQVSAIMAGLVEGDEEAASNALKSILKGRQSATPIDEESLLAKAEARIEQKKIETENGKAWQEFVESNPAFGDETSKQRQYGDFLFVSVYGPQVQAGEISYREALSKAAEDVATVFSPPVNPRQSKIDRKAAIDNLPVAGARSVRTVPAAESTEDILAEMRRERGQPV